MAYRKKSTYIKKKTYRKRNNSKRKSAKRKKRSFLEKLNSISPVRRGLNRFVDSMYEAELESFDDFHKPNRPKFYHYDGYKNVTIRDLLIDPLGFFDNEPRPPNFIEAAAMYIYNTEELTTLDEYNRDMKIYKLKRKAYKERLEAEREDRKVKWGLKIKREK